MMPSEELLASDACVGRGAEDEKVAYSDACYYTVFFGNGIRV